MAAGVTEKSSPSTPNNRQSFFSPAPVSIHQAQGDLETFWKTGKSVLLYIAGKYINEDPFYSIRYDGNSKLKKLSKQKKPVSLLLNCNGKLIQDV